MIDMQFQHLPEEVSRVVHRMPSAFDPQGELTHEYRAALHDAIERASTSLHPRAGYYRRAKWGIAAAHKTLPIWSQAAPQEVGAQNILRQAERCLAGGVSVETLASENDALFVRLLDLTTDDPKLQMPGCAAFSAFAAARIVVSDLDPETLRMPMEELDPEEWEPGVFSAMAYAGGPTWEANSSTVLRKQYWSWHVQTALEAIWDPLRPPGALIET